MGSISLYCIPYVLVAIILFFLYRKEMENKRHRKSTLAVSIAAFVILWIFLGLRGHIYTDFVLYYPFYENIGNIFEQDKYFHYYEPGFVIYSKLIKTLFPNYFVWTFINTFIDLFALRFVFKRYCNSTILPFIFFMAFQGVMMEANLIRNMKALDCFFFSIPFLIDRKFLKYLILNLIGVTFHTSALLFIPLYFVLTKKLPKFFIWGGLAFVTVVYWLNLHFTSTIVSHFIVGGSSGDRLQAYLSQNEGYGFTFGYIERTVTIILFTLLFNRLKKVRKSNIIFYNCAFWYYFCHIFFADVVVLAERIPFLFIIGYWVIYPNIVGLRYKSQQFVNLGIAILISFKIMLAYSSIDSKYQNVITGIDSFNKRKIEVMKGFMEFDKKRNKK